VSTRKDFSSKIPGMQEIIAAVDALNYLEYRYLQVQIGRLEGTLFWGGIVLVK